MRSLEISSERALKLSLRSLASSETDDDENKTSMASSEISPGSRVTIALFFSYYGFESNNA